MSNNIYQNALDLQDASNISGVVHWLSKTALPFIWDEIRSSGNVNTYDVNTHPIMVLTADKLASLAHVQGITDASMDRYGEAMRIVKIRAEARRLGLEAIRS